MVEATTLTETSEVVLPDGPMMTMIPLETTIDDRFLGLLAGALPPGSGPPGGGPPGGPPDGNPHLWPMPQRDPVGPKRKEADKISLLPMPTIATFRSWKIA